jgi:membrane protease YdiL (CAAX protease family)
MESKGVDEAGAQLGWVRRYAAACYFLLTFGISWGTAGLVAAPHVLRHEALPKLTGILMFPVMLLGPSVSGILLSGLVDGRPGVRELFGRMGRWRVDARWYLALLLPPVLVLALLKCLEVFVSPVFAANRFWLGVVFGIPAGLLEEIGWTGFAFPKLAARRSALAAGVLLGVMWALWHLPVADFLGAASPHGDRWLAFFGAFALAMTAMRVLICWMYTNTRSVLLAQLMHMSSTGALVVFGAPRVTPGQEAMWYGSYGAVLWVVVAAVAMIFGKGLTRNATRV